MTTNMTIDKKRKTAAGQEKAILSRLIGDKMVAYHPELVSVLGSVSATLFLSQLLYWHGKGSDGDGWIYKTREQMKIETGLTFRMQDHARDTLRKLNILEEKLAGMPRRLYYKIKIQNLFDLIVRYKEIRKVATDQMTELDSETVNDKDSAQTQVPVSQGDFPKAKIPEREKANKINIEYKTSQLNMTKCYNSMRQNVAHIITENTHKSTSLSPSSPSDKIDKMDPQPESKKRERFFYDRENITTINQKIKSFFHVTDTVLSTIKTTRLDYLLYLVENNRLNPENIKNVYAYCKNLVIPETFPGFPDRHRVQKKERGCSSVYLNNDHPRRQEDALVNVLKSLYPYVDVEHEIQGIKTGQTASPEGGDESLGFYMERMKQVQERNNKAAQEGFASIRKILGS
jgi:hypothetical protein